ncbi:hypothetical protein BASA81_001590 [Batrachochytrium salamandrivorans]|nr:hypothetical protein BASA81_001590 [Batrachochytrium salamandrivorans]
MYREIVLESHLVQRLGLLKNSSSAVYLYFTADKVGGERWCPDCRNAEPVLEEAFQVLPAGAYVLQIEVAKDRWKGLEGQKHFFRQAPFSLGGLPSLCEWDTKKQAVVRKFTEGECEQLEALQEMMMASSEF